MTRSAAAKATEAADAVLDWLRRQPPLVFPPTRRRPPDCAPSQPAAGATDAPPRADLPRADLPGADLPGADAAGPPAASAAPDPGVNHPPAAPASAMPAAADALGNASPGAPLRLAHTDWLHHRLVVAGPDAALAAFQAAAAGAGVIPWHLDLGRLEEDCFHLLAAPPAPQQRSLSLAGARILAGQLRDAAARRHALAVSRVGHSQACPFDLHALVPVPQKILRRGPDDPASHAWLWTHWGTTRALRHVAADPEAGQERRRRLAGGGTVWQVTFWSADWSPWRALAAVRGGFPALRFDLRPTYDMP